jgi:hypothetical protein
VRNSELCVLGQGDESRPDFLVWGDSHADALFPAFQAAALASGSLGVFAAEPACPPLLGVTRPLDRSTRRIDRCLEFNNAVAELLEAEDIGNVFLAARWNVSAFGRTPFELATGQAEVFLNDAQSTEVSLAENLRTFERGLHRTLDQLTRAGVRVWIVLQVPSAEVRVPQYLSARMRGAQVSDVRLTLTSGMQQFAEMRERIVAIVSAHGAQIIDPSEVLCSGYDCLIAKDGYNVYRDDDHLSVKGALLLQSTFEQILNGIEK